MAKKHTKLELTWIGKGDDPKLEPRILIEDPAKRISVLSSRGQNTDSLEPTPTDENILIHGDNLLALKALEQEYTGKIKCIYIDPPFNTGQAFEHYDDSLEHSIWLNLISRRLKILYKLLDKDGLLWLHLDDSEVHYCKVLLDELFGRSGFVSHITYERSAVAGLGQGGFLVNTSEHILLYKKGVLPSRINLGFYDLDVKTIKRYNRMLVSKGDKELVREFESKSNGMPVKVYKHTNFRIESVSLKNFEEREEEIRALYAEKLGKFFRGNQIQKENSFQKDLIKGMDKASLYSVEYTPSRGKFEDQDTTLFYFNAELLSWLGDNAEVVNGKIVRSQKLTSLWDNEDIPKADIANEGGIYFPRSKKPEQLLKRIIDISTNPGDWVLDSFLGSGTTAAVAQKMGRKWIGIELGQHAHTHCYPRLKAVCEGSDQGGISKAVSWQGGGGFRFYTLAPSLLREDKWGNLVINEAYNADQLAAAMAKQEGFRYQPHESLYWKQAQSSEHDFLFTTTQFMTVEHLDRIHDEMQPGESLLICCKSFQDACTNRYANITLKKIPVMLLGRCEFNRNDYSFTIVNSPGVDSPADTDVPVAPAVSDEELIQAIDPKPARTKPKKADDQLKLF